MQIKNGKDYKNLKPGLIPVFGSGGFMLSVNKAIYENESILLPRKGTLSNIQYVNKPFWTVDTLYYSIINKEKANAYYLFNYLKQLDLSRLNSGTGVPSMTFDLYYDLEINLPGLFTQQKIAAVLSALDDKIELNNKINAELEAMAKTLYDYWFVQFDFPDANGKPYKSFGGKMVYNEVLKRKIPEGWEVYLISGLMDCNKWTIKNISNYEYINYLDTSNLTKNVIDSITKINCHTEKIPSRAVRVVFPDDILISTVRPNQLHYGIIKEPVENLIASSGFAQLRSKVYWLNNDLIYYFLTSESIIERLQQIASSSVSAYPSISSFDILKLNVCMPSDKSILLNVNKTCTSINKKISINLKQNQELSNLRDWLLPMLMNGQVSIGKAYEQEDGVFSVAAEDAERYKKKK
ncbi:MAG: restriction endonuclease subunit S [Ginsengibacter sp.]